MTDRDQASRELRALLHAERVDMARVSALLDGLGNQPRVHAVCGLGRREQSKLWDAAQGVHAIALEHLVPTAVPAGTTVRHFGRNSLPAFTAFEKRFFREPQGDVCGANFQLMSPLTGPGYFRVRPQPEQRELLIDYAREVLPRSAPAGWPAIVPNERGFSRLVYGFLTDSLRKVSDHVSIGIPARHGKPLGSWFVLCREHA